MKIAQAYLKSGSAYYQSRNYTREVPKRDDETHEAYEERTWRERCHYDKEGYIYIPPLQFKNSLSEGAKFNPIKIQGRGKETYTKHFDAGVLVTEGLKLPIKKEVANGDRVVLGEWLNVPSDGKKGGSRRVWKCFPRIDEWNGEVTYYIIDELITREIFLKVLETTGQFIGLGSFRVRNGGFCGRFEVTGLDWLDG